jgi:signal transduction histidine kinase
MSSLDTHVPRDRSARLAAVEERRRIQRDLHDGAQNALVAVRLKLGLAADRAAEIGASDLEQMLAEIGADAQLALDGVRSIAQAGAPPLLTSRGLGAALAEEARRAAVTARVRGRARRSTPAAEAAVYYSCLEALQNAAKHAGAGVHVTIRLQPAGERLRFDVADDGVGFAPAHAAHAGGLAHLRERVAAAGGELTIVSAPGAGTKVCGVVPWPSGEAAPWWRRREPSRRIRFTRFR